jgi:hypothetical protein
MKKLLTNILFATFLILFLGCEDNTQNSQIKDIQSIKIDDGDISIYSTDAPKTLSASVIYTDSTTEKITDADIWENSDYDILSMSGGTIRPLSNSGSSKVGIKVGHFSDEISVDIIKIVDFNLSYENITSTGEHQIEAVGTFENNQTKKIYTNIVWETNNTSTITTDENYNTVLNIVSGDTNLTATIFGDDSDTNITKSVVFSIE